MRTQLQLKLVLAALVILSSCHQIEFKYKITGTVDTKNGKHDAIWYTDTILKSGDTAVIVNSNGTLWKIAPPYEVTELKK
jgi:hypothetical protein